MLKHAPERFQQRLLTWFDDHGRKNLPWQIDKTPYRIWVSEIMLQQTQVITVIPYFERFISRFPDILTLATANQDEVLAFWSGLGYYHRARNLHKAALHIVANHQGQFPESFAEIVSLPGIGRTTAGAILATAFGKKAAILDGNVKRVLTRMHGIKKWPGLKEINEELWILAEHYTPAKRVGDYTQAIMDLGAAVCVRSHPRCDICPISALCQTNKEGLQKEIPAPKPKSIRPVRTMTFVILYQEEYVLLAKRPEKGFWAGLWSFPMLAHSASADEIQLFCQETFHLEAAKIEFGDRFRHTFTHFHLDIIPSYIKLKKKIALNNPQYLWHHLLAKTNIGTPAPVTLLLQSKMI